ncbi:MAG: type IV secretory system conjugative DNA transfer family protein [Acidimicrobiales bacterium]
MNERPVPRSTNSHAEALLLVAGLAFAATGAWVWTAGEVAGWVTHGRWPAVPVAAAATIVLRLPAHLGDPRVAWPASARSSLPGAGVMDLCALSLLVLAAVPSVWLAARSGPLHGLLTGAPRGRVGGVRRDRGARWATGADLRSLRAGWRRPRSGTGPRRRARSAGRLVLGRWAGTGGPERPGGSANPSSRRRGRLLATEARHSVLVVGPTQSGKTTGLAVPALLEWGGPVVATSVKDDLASTTLAWRSRQGPTWMFDPTRSTGLRPASSWTPLAACDDWSSAQRVATWLVDATPARSGMADAAFWYATAAKQLAPLLLAASRSSMVMADVARWTDTGDFEEPGRLLDLAGETEAAVALAACGARDDRLRSSVSTTLETVLAPFEDPTVAASTEASDIDLDTLLTSSGSLYLCGPSHEQHRVQGLFAALVSSVVAAAVRHANAAGGRLDPPLLLVLDEAANIAPVRDLDTLASTAAGLGVQLVTVCQDLAQLGARYGTERARTIANNHRAKILL